MVQCFENNSLCFFDHELMQSLGVNESIWETHFFEIIVLGFSLSKEAYGFFAKQTDIVLNLLAV